MLIIAIILFIILLFFLFKNKQENFIPVDIHHFNRTLIKNQMTKKNLIANNYNFEPIDNEIIYRDDVTSISNTFLARDLEKILKRFIVQSNHKDTQFIEVDDTYKIIPKKFEFIVDKLLNMFQNAIFFSIFKTNQYKYIICPNINSCRIQLIDRKILVIRRHIKNINIERWNIIIEFYITGKTNSFVLEILVEYYNKIVLLLNVKVIGKNSNSIIKIPEIYKHKNILNNSAEPYYYRDPQLNIFNEKNTEYNTQKGYYMNNETDTITSFKSEKELEKEADTYLSQQRISLSATPNNYFIDQYKCYGSKGDNQVECENNYDNYFKPKKRGVWDTICKVDSDCPFFKANKNYENNFGGCVQGVCEMPMGIQRLGNRYYNIDTKPLCHNCAENGKDCCDNQDIPDYIFKDDLFVRKMNEQELNQKGLGLI